MMPGRVARCTLAALTIALATRAQQPEPASPPPAAGSLDDALARLSAVWTGRDVDGYLALWGGMAGAAREQERGFAEEHLTAGECQIYPQGAPADLRPGRATVGVQTFTIREPRAMVEDWLFTFERRGERWIIVERQALGRVDGLVHLSLDSQGYRADGLKIELEDFELTMVKGTFFIPPATLGPTAIVFVGDGRFHFTPRPTTEREQLRQFSGGPELTEHVRSAFVRVHPADVLRVLTPARFEPDPRGAERLDAAQRVYRDQVSRSFVLDANLPGAPWSLLPGVGDSLTTFETRKHGTLTFTVSSTQPESISLFDRVKRRQICLYPGGGRDIRYGEDDGRNTDLLDHDIRLRVEPNGDDSRIEGEDRVHVRLLNPSPTLRLRLDQGLRVRSVTSETGGNLLFFRVRNHDEVMVSLGALGARGGDLALTVRYAGTLAPGPIEREVIQVPAYSSDDTVLLENVLVFTNRNAWYPQTETDDYATANLRFDLPPSFTAVTGGVRTAARTENGRSIVEYRQDKPGKYVSVAIGRLREAGSAKARDVAIEAFGTARTRRSAAEALSLSSQILNFFSEEFGPAPYPTLNLVLVEGRTPGGHSPPGMIVLSQRPITMRGSLKEDPGAVSSAPGFFLAHEIAHQWWGHGIAGKNYHERWLSEGFAQYAAALWIRKSEGQGAFEDVLRRMAYWARRDAREGPISLGYRLGHLKDDPQIYRAIVYDKAAYVLQRLREITGDDAFRRGLTSLQQAQRFRKVGTDDLRVALEAASGLDLGRYFDAWVFGTDVPALQASDRAERHGSDARRDNAAARAR